MFRLEQNNLFAATSLDKGGNDVAEILRKYRVVNPGRSRYKVSPSKMAAGVNRKQRKARKAGNEERAHYLAQARHKRELARARARTTNPSKKRMTLKQKLHFGTARQRAAAKAALSGARKRVGNPSRTSTARAKRKLVRKIHRGLGFNMLADNTKGPKHMSPQYLYKMDSSRARGRQKKAPFYRIGNPAQIITLTNPGTPRKSKGTSIMAKRKTYKRRTVGTPRKRYARRRNTGMSASRRHASKRYTRRHRNAGVLSSGFGQAFGIIGGGVVTSLITSRLPAGLNAGFAGYLSTAVVALVQGTLAGKVLKNQALGKSMTIGGFVYLGLRLVQDFVPNLQLPFRIGAIAPSSFYTPQVPMPNSMVAFQTPAAVTAAMPMPMAGTGGMGRVGRIGRAR